jgi:tetratricopeptide (TPR) repeat protein
MNVVKLLIFIPLISACGNSKKLAKEKDQSKEKTMQEQGKDDANVLDGLGKKDFPYMEAFHAGLRYKSAKNYLQAKMSFDKCLSIKQNDDAVYYAISQIAFAQKNTSEGVTNLKKAADLDPKNLWYQQELAYSYLNENDFKNAVVYFDKFLKKEERNPELIYAYAEALTLSGDYDRAIPQYEKVQSIVGKAPEITIRMFQILATQNKLEKAEKVLLDAYEDDKSNSQILGELQSFYKQTNQKAKADKLMSDKLLKNPKDGTANMMLYEQNKKTNPTEALKNVMNILESTELNPEVKANILIDLQSNEINPSNLIEPAQYFAKNHPEMVKAQLILGDVYLNTDQTKLAFEQYKKGLKLDEGNFQIWNQVLSLAFNEYDHAFLYTEGKRCVELFPSQVKAYLFAGSGAIGEQKFEEAKTLLNNGKEYIVKDKDMQAEFETSLGEAYFGLKNKEEGIKAFEKSLLLSPKDAGHLNRFALALANSKTQLDKSVILNEEAIALVPKNEEYTATKAWIFQQKGEKEQAITTINSALTLNSKNGFVHEIHGNILSKQAKNTEAVIAWKKAKELGIKSKLLDKKIETKTYHEFIN